MLRDSIDSLIRRIKIGNYKRAMNNNHRDRLDSEQTKLRGGTGMIKGTQRRIVVVKSPDPEIFEEAIFIVKDDFLRADEVSSEKLIKEAQRIAHGYAQYNNGQKVISRLPAPAFAAVGAAVTCLAWFVTHLAGM